MERHGNLNLKDVSRQRKEDEERPLGKSGERCMFMSAMIFHYSLVLIPVLFIYSESWWLPVLGSSQDSQTVTWTVGTSTAGR